MKHLVLFVVALATLCAPASAQYHVKNVYTSLGDLDCAQVMNTEQPIQLNRYLIAGYNTLCLPMTVTAEQIQATVKDARVERMVAIGQKDNTLALYFMDCTNEGIEAGIPYLIFTPKTQYLRLKNTEAVRLDDNLQTIRLADKAGNIVSFGSSWETVSREGLYGIPAKQETPLLESILIRTTAEKIFLPTRCGVNWEQQANDATDIAICHIKSLDEVTGIQSMVNGQLTIDKSVYDMNGRKVNSVKKGIVIQNGKKVVNK